MTNRHPFRLALLAAVSAGSILLAAGAQPEQPDDPNSVAAHMHAADKAFRALRKQVSDPTQNASSLERIQELEEHLVAAKKFHPDEWDAMPEAQRNDMIKGFHKDLATEVGLVLDVEKALIDGDNKAAAAGIDKVRAGQKDGHEKYKPKDDDQHEGHGGHGDQPPGR